MMSQTELTARTCKPCEGSVPAMTEEEIVAMLQQVGGWAYVDGHIEKALWRRPSVLLEPSSS